MNKIDVKVRDKSGIYLIVNLINGKRYIGSSREIYGRLHDHWHNLKNNCAHNIHLQNSWNKNGEDAFVWAILEYCDESVRFEREQYYIDILKPEYNLTTNVVANFGHSPSEESRKKISETLKRKYASGEIKTYRQEHNWKKCYVYNISDFTFAGEFKCIADASRAIGATFRSSRDATRGVLLNKYIIVLDKFLFLSDLKNYVFEKFYKRQGNVWLTSEVNGVLYYHKITKELFDLYGISRSMAMKQRSKVNKYYIHRKAKHVKIKYIDKFVPLPQDAVPIEESLELLQTKNGEDCDVNTVVNTETKESVSPYSVEIEPDKSE